MVHSHYASVVEDASLFKQLVEVECISYSVICANTFPRANRLRRSATYLIKDAWRRDKDLPNKILIQISKNTSFQVKQHLIVVAIMSNDCI